MHNHIVCTMIIHIVWCWYMGAYGKKVNIYYVYAWRERAICDVAKKERLHLLCTPLYLSYFNTTIFIYCTVFSIITLTFLLYIG